MSVSTVSRFLGVLSLLVCASAVTAETFTISPPSDPDSCNEEFENVANSLEPGDELVLLDGVYSQGCARRISVTGTPDNPIVIRAAEGASPLITRPNSTSSQNNNIELSGAYYTISGLNFQYGSSGVRFMGSSNITFENNSIFDTLNNALTMNSGATDSHIIRNNEIYNTGLASGQTEGEGMYIGQHSGGSPATNHLIENNYIHDLRSTSGGGNDGIEVKFGSGGNIIRGNVIHDTNIGVEFPCIFVYGHGAAPNIVENNLLYNCGEAILVTADAIIRNNVILNSSINGIHLRVQNPAPNVQNVTIVNNTVYGSHPVCAQLRIGSAPNITVSNNAFYCGGSTAVAGNGFSNAVMENNVVRGNLSGVSIDNTRFIQGTAGAENFMDPSMQDFRLIEGSALIDVGSSSAPDIGTMDFAGTARISGSAVDVGAHEFEAVSSQDPPELTFEGPASVDLNSEALLTWSATNATSCTASGGWQGARATSGAETTSVLTSVTDFTLTCTGGGGSVTESLTVNINQPPAEPPTLNLQGPASVDVNTTAELSWNTTNATSCTASDGWQGVRSTSGSEMTGVLTVATLFTLTCTGDGGNVTETLTINVNQPPPVPPTLTLQGPVAVVVNTAAMLSWDTTNAANCTASEGWQGDRSTSGAETTTALAEATSFTLTCTGAGGTVSQTVTVAVTQPSPDSDADGLLDAWEQLFFNNLDQSGTDDPDGDLLHNLGESNAGTDPTKADTDDDGLNDSEEATHSTNPLIADSDGDGSNDFDEVQAGTDPNDASSNPTQVTPPIVPSVQNDTRSGSGPLNPLMVLVISVFAFRRRL